MTAYEVMLSESQERMLVIAKREHVDDVRRLFERWELHCEPIGVVTNDGMATIRDGASVVARVPVTMLTDPPQYVRDGVKPAWLLLILQSYDLEALPDHGAGRPSSSTPVQRDVLEPARLTGDRVRRPVYRQYDHQVLTNTVIGPGSDAAVLRVKGTRKALALATDGDGRLCFLDPFVGGAMAVAEATRNVVCAGAHPVAVTDCLNFGNPEKPEVYYQLEQAIRGMAAACEALGVPVVSGNVSLYNETSGEAIYPTPVVGALGLIDDVDRVVTMGFRDEGDDVFVLGIAALRGDAAELAGSEYLKLLHNGLIAGQPKIDLDMEAHVQRVCLDAARSGLLKSAHDCSRGGLGIALAKCCLAGGHGLAAPDVTVEGRIDAALFGEAPSRIVVSTADRVALETLTQGHGVPLVHIGRVGGDRLVIGAHVDCAIEELRSAYEGGRDGACDLVILWRVGWGYMFEPVWLRRSR